MKQNTAMHEMIKWMDKHPVDITSVAYRKAKELLKKEEEQIKKAYNDGISESNFRINSAMNMTEGGWDDKNSEQYFKQTYNNQ